MIHLSEPFVVNAIDVVETLAIVNRLEAFAPIDPMPTTVI